MTDWQRCCKKGPIAENPRVHPTAGAVILHLQKFLINQASKFDGPAVVTTQVVVHQFLDFDHDILIDHLLGNQ